MKRILSILIAAAMLICMMPAVFAEDAADTAPFMTAAEAEELGLPAFPGAEGGGKFTTGGRGGEVYHVTNLNDDGEGSLRAAVSGPNRTVVFDVSGTIYLKSSLKLMYPNITIAGQTAPGDGICLADYNISIEADNVIIRYMRFRLGSVESSENDAISSRYHKNIIVDHCSTSWSTDETLSIYAVADTTVQWCIASESLTLAVHAKGRHGYGGIWGGANVTYHHNLMANHTSRMPRYGSLSSTHPDYEGISGNDMVNNVIYNWGFNNSYGGEKIINNVVNNYYKSGPITNAVAKNRIWNPSQGGRFYFSGNVLEGNKEVTNDNIKGVFINEGNTPPDYANAPDYTNLRPMDNVDTAEEAYKKVLAGAGATLPKRDSYDAKIVNDVKNSTGRAINNENEVGGYPELKSTEAPLDTDGDGMPDDYEDANGLSKSDPSDGAKIGKGGYTNLENYLNGIVENSSQPHNPEVTLDIENNSCYSAGSDIQLKATAKADTSADSNNKIAKVEFYNGNQLVGEATQAPYACTMKNAQGEIAYMSAKAIDTNGESTTSEIKVININGTGSAMPWQTMDIGDVPVEGSYSCEGGVYTVKSSGLIGPGNEFNIESGDPKRDSFSYMYQNVDEYAVLTTKIDSVSKLNNNCKSGLMIRDELTETSDFVMVDYEYEKGGAGLRFAYRLNGEWYSGLTRLETLPRWIKLVKMGNAVTAFHSENGVDWNMLDQTLLNFSGINYAGVAQDGNKETNDISTLAWGKFSNLTLDNYGSNKLPLIGLEIRSDRSGISAEQGQYYTTDNIYADVTSADSEELYKVDLYVDGKLYAEDSDAPFETQISGLAAGSHSITAVAYDKDGAKQSLTTNIGVSNLENMSGWDVVRLGGGKLNGGFDFDGNGGVTIYAPGYGVADTEYDDCSYAYTQMSGDFTASFKIDEQAVADYDQIGFILRDGLDVDSRSYTAYFQRYNGEFLKQTEAHGEKYETLGQVKYKKTPVWMKLIKSGNTLKAEMSEDGTVWKEIASCESKLSENYYLGIFGASNEDFKVSEFKLSEFKLSGGAADGYVDMSGYEWTEEAVSSLTAQGIINGELDENGNKYFCPSRNVTRAEFAKMAVEAYKKTNPTAEATEYGEAFLDVPVDSTEWHTPYIYQAKAYGLILGTLTEQGMVFNPDDTITREEMAAIIYRTWARSAAIDAINVGTLNISDKYIDAANISDWAQRDVLMLNVLGIMQGDQNNCFNPQNFADRAEAAQVIYNYLAQK